MEETIVLTDNISKADALLGLHSKLKKNPQIETLARSYDIPVFVTKVSSSVQKLGFFVCVDPPPIFLIVLVFNACRKML